MRFQVAAWVLLATIVGCKKAPEVSRTSYIIGDTDDIETVEGKLRDDVPEAHLNSAVLLGIRVDLSRRKYCSGTLIAGASAAENPRIITNHHCFTDDGDGKGPIPRETIKNPCENVFVHFAFLKGETDKSPSGRCLKGSFRNDYEGDLAVFTLEKAPEARFKPAQFWTQAEVPAGRNARIVHHPTIDPDKNGSRENLVFDPTLGVQFPVAQVTRTNCVTVGRFAQSEWGLDKALGMGIKHTCDQRHGSSGSSLWDVETNTILGVNWGGIVLSYRDSSEAETYNVATRSAYVVAFLEGRNEQEKANIALGADLPDNDSKIASAGRKTKDALRTGCGVIGRGESTRFHLFLLGIIMCLPLATVVLSRRRRKSR